MSGRTTPPGDPLILRHEGEVVCCAFAPRQPWVVSGGWDGQVLLWDRKTGKPIKKWKASAKAVTACSLSPDGSKLLTGSLDGFLAQWDLGTQASLSTFLAHTRPISAITFAPDGKLLATSSWDRTLVLWRPDREREGKTLTGHQDIVSGCCFTADGRHLLSWSHDLTLRLWDLARARQAASWPAHACKITAGAASPDGRWFASGDADGTVLIWDAMSRQEAARYRGPPSEIRGCFFAPDAELLLTAAANGEIMIHPVPDLRNQTGRETGWSVRCAALAPTGELWALGAEDGRFHLVSLEGMAERPMYVTPVETYEQRPGMVARFLGRQQFQRVFRCTCPACHHAFELDSRERISRLGTELMSAGSIQQELEEVASGATPFRAMANLEMASKTECPYCRRPLRVNLFTLKA